MVLAWTVEEGSSWQARHSTSQGVEASASLSRVNHSSYCIDTAHISMTLSQKLTSIYLGTKTTH